jgi:O-antigen biosynthesis protein
VPRMSDGSLTQTAAWRRSLRGTAGSLLPLGTRRRHLIDLTIVATRRWHKWRRILVFAARSSRQQRMSLPPGDNGRSWWRPPPGYTRWICDRAPTAAELASQRRIAAGWAYRPLVSVCIPVHDPDPLWLAQAIESVEQQSYDNWEICIGDDASTRDGVGALLAVKAAADSRIKVVTRTENGGISRATNSALDVAMGEYAAFLDHDDFIEPHTLYLAIRVLQADPGIDMFYCDEDLLSLGGRRVMPLLKPAWSPELILGINYVTHFVIARRSVVDAVGRFRPERDGGQDHDLVLRLSEHTSAIHHIPEVLYTWRQSPQSTSLNERSKPWAYDASVGSVRDALERRGVPARVSLGVTSGHARVSYDLPDPAPHVEIQIPTRDRVDLLRPCIDSVMEVTDYPNFSLTVIDNDSRDPETLEFLRRGGWKVVPAPGPFNYSAIINAAIRATESEFVLTLNNDTCVQQRDWLRQLMELCARPGVGAVGCRLVRPNGTLQHEGIVMGRAVPAANLVFDNPEIRIDGLLRCTRDVSAVTGACCITRRAAWAEINGLDESLPVDYNDVDYCLRLRRAGWRILYTPHVTVIHAESASRGAPDLEQAERRLRDRWGLDADEFADEFFTPRLRPGPWGWQLATIRPDWGAA